MRRIRAFARTAVLIALFATTSQPAIGQVQISGLGVYFGTEIQTDQLGEFLAKNLTIAFDPDMQPLSVTLAMQLISREEGAIGKYESEAVKVEPGKTYSGETFIKPESRTYAFAPGFGDRRKVYINGFGRTVLEGDISNVWRSPECSAEAHPGFGGATHAVLITITPEDERTQACANGCHYVCLNVQR